MSGTPNEVQGTPKCGDSRVGDEREGLPTQSQYWSKSELVGALNEAVERFENAEARVGQLTQELQAVKIEWQEAEDWHAEKHEQERGRVTELEAKARAAKSVAAAPDYDEEAIRYALWGLVDAVLSTSKEETA